MRGEVAAVRLYECRAGSTTGGDQLVNSNVGRTKVGRSNDRPIGGSNDQNPRHLNPYYER
jgi:hypothetical protein